MNVIPFPPQDLVHTEWPGWGLYPEGKVKYRSDLLTLKAEPQAGQPPELEEGQLTATILTKA